MTYGEFSSKVMAIAREWPGVTCVVKPCESSARLHFRSSLQAGETSLLVRLVLILACQLPGSIGLIVTRGTVNTIIDVEDNESS